MNTEKEIGERLKLKREQKGITRSEVSLSISHSPQTIFLIENGRQYPTMLVFIKLCEIYECDLSEIIILEFNK